jgi:hypothetical protein
MTIGGIIIFQWNSRKAELVVPAVAVFAILGLRDSPARIPFGYIPTTCLDAEVILQCILHGSHANMKMLYATNGWVDKRIVIRRNS